MKTNAYWYNVYQKIAEKLFEISQKESKPGEYLYDKLTKDIPPQNIEFHLSQKVISFTDANPWINKLEKTRSIDPIHLFASLNSMRLKEELRINRINAIFRALDMNEMFDGINFEGCPTPAVINTLSPRNNDSQHKIWYLFIKVMSSTVMELPDLSEEFTLVNNRKWLGVGIPMLTMFLFWIKPNRYISYDNNTFNLLQKINASSEVPNNYEAYKKILDTNNVEQFDSDIYKLLVKLAYQDQEIIIDKQNNNKNFNSLRNFFINNHLETKQFLFAEKIIIGDRGGNSFVALKILDNSDVIYTKTLKSNTWYFINNEFTENPDDCNKLIYKSKQRLFDIINLSLSISAIVGKNGTGKSTIIELIFAMLNNICAQLKISDCIATQHTLNVELVFEQSSVVYNLQMKNDIIKLRKYNEQNNNGSTHLRLNTKLENIQDKLFFMLSLNYSIFATNDTHDGYKWMKSLYHRSDNYMTPILQEPMREDGNINIRKQDYLVKQRLISNLLICNVDNEIEYPFHKITEFYEATKVSLKINHDKLKKLNEMKIDISRRDNQHLMDFLNFFQLKESKNLDGNIANHAKNYLIYKSLNILVDNLTQKINSNDIFQKRILDIFTSKINRKEFLDDQNRINYDRVLNHDELKNTQKMNSYIQMLKLDQSHITYKLKQIINFLEFYDELKYTEDVFDIKDLADKIHNKINALFKDGQNKMEEVHFAPPAIFDIDIILNEAIPFSSLSSGEKQIIYSIQTILYHLRNLNSSLSSSKHVHIILDEIELYFHPELQRKYINSLIYALRAINSDRLISINMIFITHSPFILSDIPKSNVLFLNKENKENNEQFSTPFLDETKTFAANIHELLFNGFFLSNSIGEFASKEIQGIVKLYHEVELIKDDHDKLDQKFEEYSKVEERFNYIVDVIGDDVLRGIINAQLNNIKSRFIKFKK